MTTFSQLIDEVIVETLRPDLKSVIVSYGNSTIRELHMQKETGAAIHFKSNILEDQLVPDVDDGFVWDIPQVQRFQGVEAVFYPNLGKYAVERYPSSLHVFDGEVNSDYKWYRSGPSLVFMGYGGSAEPINVAYMLYPRRLVYYAATGSTRLVTWDEENQVYTFDASIAGDDQAQTDALEKNTNWLLERWHDLVRQGVIAKVWARVGNVDRAKLAYSLFENQRELLYSSETFEKAGYYSR